MKQHFKVGELVVIKNYYFHGYNGKIVTITDIYHDTARGYGYKLDIKPPAENEPGRDYWEQSALRKYYPPATKTFTEIMQELKKPVTA